MNKTFLNSNNFHCQVKFSFSDLLIKCQNHEDDCANFCGLLRKAALYQQILATTFMFMIFFTRRQFRNKYKKNGTAFTISQYLERNGLEEECMSWLLAFYPDEGMAEKKSNSRTHVEYIQHCR